MKQYRQVRPRESGSRSNSNTGMATEFPESDPFEPVARGRYVASESGVRALARLKGWRLCNRSPDNRHCAMRVGDDLSRYRADQPALK
jgi:hypothetical protein